MVTKIIFAVLLAGQSAATSIEVASWSECNEMLITEAGKSANWYHTDTVTTVTNEKGTYACHYVSQ